MKHNMQAEQPYFKYWGKAAKDGSVYHLLPYHCLDVAAVAAVWWNMSPFINKVFDNNSGISGEKACAWVLFFVALHDIGKFDVRFQRKAIKTWKTLQHPVHPSFLSLADSKNYYHGPSGLYWFNDEFDAFILNKQKAPSDSYDDFFEWDAYDDDDDDDPVWQSWKPWIEAVTGHHGHLVATENTIPTPLPSDCHASYRNDDKTARKSWIKALESLFLKPSGLKLTDTPPRLFSVTFLAGFCSVADWLGSSTTETHFIYHNTPSDLADYFEQRCNNDAHEVLELAGLIGKINKYEGLKTLLKESHCPRQIQTVVDNLSDSPGLTLIEAPTGSGKTEAALAYAWRLLNQGYAESIIFALPTQATANAMLGRLNKLAVKLFKQHPNLLLAHGSAMFNKNFLKLRELGQTAQEDEDEAWAQCGNWLAQSRKRAFLGQIGVCTIDQVLISVLPVRHRFIRGFGLGKSVIIIDEVHAYDTYMYGLMKAVLKDQTSVGGSVVLLSATLPDCQRQALFQAWDSHNKKLPSANPPYPLVSQVRNRQITQYTLTSDQLPENREVFLEDIIVKDCFPTEALIEKIIKAAEVGANVVLICNLVDVVQKLFRMIRKKTSAPVLLFHSRFTLNDRQYIEEDLLNRFGDNAKRSGGAILIATQVVEQSLDIDFDWMITQICPADLLFQRIGRLHRHSYKDSSRPVDFKTPCCTVLLPDSLDYGLHGLIYANTRVMWRTIQKIEELNGNPLIFPDAYRAWIESVYDENAWGNEPEEIEKAYRKFIDNHQCSQQYAAKLMLNNTKNMTPLTDDDHDIIAVTRDGPMSLMVLPYKRSAKGAVLRDGQCWEALKKPQQPEALAMNKVSVPQSWQNVLDKYIEDKEGVYWLAMDVEGRDWHAKLDQWHLRYNKTTGLERII